LGLGLVLDDFGTGYSSLSYLLRLPFSTVKMDRQFIHEIGKDARSAALISSIITMVAGLRLSLIAEGVETREQAAELRRLGCRLMQGYLFGRPVPAAEFRALLARQSSQDPPAPTNRPG
jgi:EAL domain-containing protein (putative c-di-GMP-specific phosphodiesterase class I)